MVIAALLVGLLVGALGVLLLVRPALVERRRRTQEVIELERALAGAEAELAVERGAFDDRLASAIKNLSTDALDANSARFLELADARLAGYVRPLKDSLERMDHQLQGVERVRQEAYGNLQAQVTTLSERAGSLTNALRTPHVRGRWGEAQLRNVVEYAGMIEHCDYATQATTTTDDGTLRPDLVVRIPGGKHVVVDAKAPLAAYLDAFETSDDDARQAHLANHARQVREHVTKLSAKAYWRQFEPSPDLVVMFLPDESYLRAAHEHDPALQEYAWSSNVVLASPSTLMILLRTVAMTWQQETIAESAREVSDLGRELYKRLATMGAHVTRLGKSLDGAVKAYNETVGSLERQVLVQARRFERHGITGVEPPELQPIERQARTVAAAELVDAEPTETGQHAFEVLAADVDAA
ncbi:MAG TPA: DNA recombination protein RmuC [Gaiellaceae bacterium]|jgi:DNA recombination protein RmuC|nr:DNA recombination protein RmuC [Gaiellaceae bacterium]